MERSSRAWLAVGIALSVAALTWAFWPRPVAVEVAEVVRGPFEATVDEEGKTRLRERYVVSAPLAGRLARVALREGDAVEAGAPVAVLTPGLAPLLDERAMRELQARIDATQASVARATALVEGARLGVLQARNDAQRSEELARQGFVSPSRLESERLTLRGAQRTLEAAEAERHIASHEVEQARAALRVVRNGAPSTPFLVRAPISGQVMRVLQPSEADVAMGVTLLELGDVSQVEVVAELLTTEALRVRSGAKVHIERWGGDGRLAGRVRLVEPAAFTKVSALGVEEQRVKVLIELTSPPVRWRGLGDGFRVDVRIVAVAAPQAVQVPVAALFPRPDGSAGMAVFVVEDGRARVQPVTLAARNDTHAWVSSGLEPSSVVVVYPPAAMAHGLRVAIRRTLPGN